MIWTLIAQILGYAAGTLTESFTVHMLVSGLIAMSLRLSLPWILLNLFLPVIFLLPDVNPFYPLIGLILLLLVFAPVLRTKAPLFLSNDLIIESIAEELPNSSFRFFDLGCGTGSVLRALAKKFPNGIFYGFELGVVPFLVAYILSIPHRNIKIRYKNFWKQEWNKANFLYAFLSPDPMKDVTEKYLALNPKPVFLVNSFPLHLPHQKEFIAGEQRLYVYKQV